MKNLKKLSRENLKNLNGGKILPGVPGNCGDQCNLGGSTCEQFGLTCQLYWIYNSDGVATSGCLKCL